MASSTTTAVPAEASATAGDRRPASPLPSLLGLGVMAALLPLHHVWLVCVLLAGLALCVPGVLLLRALRIPAAAVERFPVFIPAAAVFVIIFAGLLADLVGPLIGISRPLDGDTTALTTFGICLLLWVAGLRAQSAARLGWLEPLTTPSVIAPLILPLLAGAGALLLTNGHGATVARIVAVVLPLTLLGCLLAANRLSRLQVMMLLFACALAAEWAFSLRSQEIVGYDISTEVGLAERIHSAGVWHALNRGNAYGAMLSLTVLPSALASLTGIAPLIAFKAVYPVLTALLPVSVFLVGERVMRRPFAAGAAALVIVQSYFFEQLPQIARQEIGLLFFVALIGAIFYGRTSRRGRAPLVVLMAVGLVVSHYSSTYMAIALCAAAIVVDLVVSNRRILAGNSPVMLLAFVTLAGGAAIWYGPVTHSANNLTSFTRTLEQDGLRLFPSSSGNFIKSYLDENVGQTVTAQRYEVLAVDSYRGRSGYIHPLKAASKPRFRLRPASVSGPPPRWRTVRELLNDFAALFNELLLAFSAIGTLLALRSRRRRIRAMGVLAAGMVAILAVFRFSATLAGSYNLTRALLQGLLILTIPAALLAERLTSRFENRARAILPLALALAVSLMFAYQDGASWLALRGGAPLNLSQSGEDFERFYETPAELASARWAAAASRGGLLYADRYGSLRLATTSGLVPLSQVTPMTLDRHAWVYASRTNTLLGRARGQAYNDYALYEWPGRFLGTYFDTVFNDGDSKIYHR